MFSVKSLLSSCMKPYTVAKSGNKVSMAGKEYFQHAASFQVHFFELTALVKHRLNKERL
jgi:hypothetical protein